MTGGASGEPPGRPRRAPGRGGPGSGRPDAAGAGANPASLPEGLRMLRADNAGPYTLDGTRSFIVGRERAVVIDPGPADDRHLAALSRAGARVILLTHGHPDHAAGAAELARTTDASILAAGSGNLHDGDSIETDAGELVAVATPGHSPDHFAFHWPAAGAVFVGDLMLGGMDTAFVGTPDGDLAAYLASLETVRRLRPNLLIPAHGPPFIDPDAALDAYVAHRRKRQRQVLDALATAGDPESIVEAVYGPDLPERLRGAATASVLAYLLHLEAGGAVRRTAPGEWEPTGDGRGGS